MKTKLSGAALGVALITVSWCLGCQRQSEGVASFAAVQLTPLIATAEPQALEPAPQNVPTQRLLSQEAQNNISTTEISGPRVQGVADTNTVEKPIAPHPLQLTPGLADVVKLIQAGVGEEVLMVYITNSSEVFDIGSDEILYLHDMGAPPSVITTLIQHDLVRKQAAATAKPLPPGVALTRPLTNVVPARTIQQGVVPVNPPNETAAVTSPDPLPSEGEPEVVYATPIAPQTVTVAQFYTELAPYGTWVDVPGYGHCWRPTVAVWNSSWRPYGDGGRWLWTDSGWYWYSDYSWGWAPFHYGRWSCPSGIGWVWTPDTHWGPAWVSWRSTRSHCGWAPLPPAARFVAGHGFFHNDLSVGVDFDFGLSDEHYVFLPTSRFCDRRLSGHYLGRHHTATVYKESTVVNNYVTVNKSTVINKGVGFERIASATRGNIRQVALQGTSEVRGTNLRRETLDAEGKTLTVARPAPTAATMPAVRSVGARSRTPGQPVMTAGMTTSSPEPAAEGASAGRRFTAPQARTPAVAGRETTPAIEPSPSAVQTRQVFITPRTRRVADQTVRHVGGVQAVNTLSTPAIPAPGVVGAAPAFDQPRPARSGLQAFREPSPAASPALIPNSSVVRPVVPRAAPRQIQAEPAAPRNIGRVPESTQPRYSAPPPSIPSAPSSRPVAAPSSRVESYRAPTAPSAPSAPPPARSDGGSRPRPSNDNGGAGRGPR
jgi:hypothetical protein